MLTAYRKNVSVHIMIQFNVVKNRTKELILTNTGCVVENTIEELVGPSPDVSSRAALSANRA